MFGERGVKLFKNGEFYFSFTKKDVSGVQVHCQDNDTLDIGKDEGFQIDDELKVPTQYTVESSKIRRKQRRIIVRNKNNFFVNIIAATKTPKVYTIASFSQIFIFFGKDPCKLYIIKGTQVLTNRTPAIQPKQLDIYVSLIDLNKLGVSFRFHSENGDEKYFGHTEKFALKNHDKFSISLVANQKHKETIVALIVGSDPANQNILVSLKDGLNTVIQPGNVSCIPFTLVADKPQQIQVFNRLIKTIKIYETTDFRIPFKTIPYIRMSTSMQVDVLNTCLLDLQNELKEERKRKGEVGDCEILSKMLYSTFFPFKDNIVTAWAFAILFTNEKGLDKVLITMMALTRKFNLLGKYLITEKLLTEFISTVKNSYYYKSNVTNLIKKDPFTFLFELNISENGFIVCMYRPAKEATFWEEPWRWFTELPTKA